MSNENLTAADDDKCRKAHAEEVDISNGALHLRVVFLEQEIKYLKSRIEKLIRESRRNYNGPIN